MVCPTQYPCEGAVPNASEIIPDEVARTQVFAKYASPYIPPEERDIAIYPPAYRCKNSEGVELVVHAISFSVPYSQVTKAVDRRKISDFDKIYLRYGDNNGMYVKPYDMHDEHLARFEVRHSYLARTTNRYGWDSLRHYEILAEGAVPFFC